MALTKTQKSDVIKKAKDAIEGAESVVFVNFSGLTVKDSDELRKKLRESDGRLMVVKKTLLELALKESKREGEIPALPGEVAIAYGPDAIMPAKNIAEFGRLSKDKVKIVGGIFESRYMDAMAMNEIALIPSRETLLGMLANVWSSPVRGLVIAIDALAQKQA